MSVVLNGTSCLPVDHVEHFFSHTFTGHHSLCVIGMHVLLIPTSKNSRFGKSKYHPDISYPQV